MCAVRPKITHSCVESGSGVRGSGAQRFANVDNGGAVSGLGDGVPQGRAGRACREEVPAQESSQLLSPNPLLPPTVSHLGGRLL